MRNKAQSRFDRIDKKILALLQEDASLSLQEIAAKVNLSPTPCWRRIQKLRSGGVIRQQVAVLDPVAINVPITVFVTIKTNQHNAAWLERFARGVAELTEVTEFYRMSGDVDYLLRVVVPDIAGYDVFYKKLIKTAELFDVSSSFAMEQIKYTTALPLDYA
jgi:Lrp/AsnC family transcriptional regulator